VKLLKQRRAPSEPLATCTPEEIKGRDPAVQLAEAQLPLETALAQLTVIAETGIVLHPPPPVKPVALTLIVQFCAPREALLQVIVAAGLPATLGTMLGLVAEKLTVAGETVGPEYTNAGRGLVFEFAMLAGETGWRRAFVCPHAKPTVRIAEVNTASFREQYIPRSYYLSYAAEIVQVMTAA